MVQPGSWALAGVALLLIGAAAGGLVGRLLLRAAALREQHERARQAAERIAALTAENAELARDRDLLAQSQRLGKLGYIISDLTLGRVYWSDSLFELRRVPKRPFFTFDEAIAFVHPEDRDRFFALRTAAVAGRRDWELDNRILRGDGTMSWEHAIGRPRFDAAGAFTGALVILQDITERKETEASLALSQAEFKSAFQDSADAMIILRSRDRVMMEVNAAAESGFGWTREEMLGKTVVGLGLWPAAAESDAAWEALLRHGAIRGFPALLRTRTGARRETLVTASVFAAGAEGYVISVIRDVTEARAAERKIVELNESLTASLRRLRAIADNLPALVVYLDAERRFRFMNKTAERWLATTFDAAEGKTVADALPVDYAQSTQEVRDRLAAGETREEATVRYPDGVTRTVEVAYVRDVDAAGAIRGYYVLAVDITARKAIEDENRLLSLVARNTTNSVILSNADRSIEWVNAAFTRATGYALDEIRGRIAVDLLRGPGTDAATIARMREQGARGEAYRDVELQCYTKDRQPYWVSLEVQPIRDAAGKVVQLLSIGTNITARKEAEAALRESHGRFVGAFRGSADFMSISRARDNVIIEANEAAETVTGWRREELIGEAAAGRGLWADGRDRDAVMHQLAAVGHVREYPMQIRTRSGELRDVLLTASRFEANDEAHVLLIFRDVSAARRAERKIAELNESLTASLRQVRAIADNLPALIVYIDAEGRYRFLNRTAERWLATTAAAAEGRTAAEVMPADYIAATVAYRDRLLAGPRREEATISYPDGVTRTIDIRSVADMDADGNLLGHYVLALDISERKAVEEQLRQSQKLEAIGKLTGGVAHDFNNLLAVISGNLELAEEALPDREDVRAILLPAMRATERGARLTQSLLAYARQQPLNPSATDLSDLVREMTDLLRRTIPSNIEFKLVIDDGLWTCDVDPGQLQNALLNLVVNARDAMPDGGRLTIEIGNAVLDADYAAANAEVAPGDYVMLAVSDTGIGMPPEVAARAFEPFFTTKEVGKGTGLGLSMVYGFAKQSKGHAKIYSEPGQGTTVRVYLPHAAGAEQAVAAAPEPEDARASGETVLVVEDDADFRELAVAMLGALGYRVLEAAGAAEALRLLDGGGRIDLLLTDIMLAGGMNGRQLAEQAARLRRGLKVLYMSGYTENAILHQGRLDRGVHLLQKPFRRQDLAGKVRQALERAAP